MSQVPGLGHVTSYFYSTLFHWHDYQQKDHIVEGPDRRGVRRTSRHYKSQVLSPCQARVLLGG